MICLDTNYLICGLSVGTHEESRLIEWHKRGEIIATPSICWYEFMSGPVTDPQIQAMKAFLRGGIIPFGEAEAIKAAELYNASNRMRRLRVDVMIAATAMAAKAKLASSNRGDFESFIQHGLKLI